MKSYTPLHIYIYIYIYKLYISVNHTDSFVFRVCDEACIDKMTRFTKPILGSIAINTIMKAEIDNAIMRDTAKWYGSLDREVGGNLSNMWIVAL